MPSRDYLFAPRTTAIVKAISRLRAGKLDGIDNVSSEYWTSDRLRVTWTRSDEEQRQTVSKPFVIIGSDPKCDIVLAGDHTVPRRAYFVVLHQGRFLGLNLKARSREEAKFRPVEPERGIGIGEYRLRFEIDRSNRNDVAKNVKNENGSTITSDFVLVWRVDDRKKFVRLRPDKPLVLGRVSPTIAIHDESISSVHAFLLLSDKNLWVVDLLSTNGLRKKGQNQRLMLLSDGDRFRAGNLRFAVSNRQSTNGENASKLNGETSQTRDTSSDEKYQPDFDARKAEINFLRSRIILLEDELHTIRDSTDRLSADRRELRSREQVNDDREIDLEVAKQHLNNRAQKLTNREQQLGSREQKLDSLHVEMAEKLDTLKRAYTLFSSNVSRIADAKRRFLDEAYEVYDQLEVVLREWGCHQMKLEQQASLLAAQENRHRSDIQRDVQTLKEEKSEFQRKTKSAIDEIQAQRSQLEHQMLEFHRQRETWLTQKFQASNKEGRLTRELECRLAELETRQKELDQWEKRLAKEQQDFFDRQRRFVNQHATSLNSAKSSSGVPSTSIAAFEKWSDPSPLLGSPEFGQILDEALDENEVPADRSDQGSTP